MADQIQEKISPTEKIQLLTRALLRQAKEAAEDPCKLFEFAIKDEKSKQPLKAAPHQKLMFSFAEQHPQCVIRAPIGCAKTYQAGTMALSFLGKDRSTRGGIYSKVQKHSKKILSMVSDYISDPVLGTNVAAVFPGLQPSPRTKDPWTTEQIVVDRPAGTKDPSLVAVGIESKVQGSRLDWAIGDDLVDNKNSKTKEAREELINEVENQIVSRVEAGGPIFIINTPWHHEDLTFYLELKCGWPTLTMDIYGFVRVSNADAAWMAKALDTMLRPSTTREDPVHDWYRLTAFDPDPEEETPLFAERYPLEKINALRYGVNGRGGMLPFNFARQLLCNPTPEDSARCERQWIERCKLLGIGQSMVSSYTGPNPTYTAMDIGIGKKVIHDRTVFFTIEKLPDGSRKILEIETGRFSGPDIVSKAIQKADSFGSTLWVENNGAQDFIRQFAKDKKKDLKIKAHSTQGKNKWDVDWGVESIFSELEAGAWIIPCDRSGQCHPEVQRFIDQCLFYQPPPYHTGDVLMAGWIAREASRGKTSRRARPSVGKPRQMTSMGSF